MCLVCILWQKVVRTQPSACLVSTCLCCCLLGHCSCRPELQETTPVPQDDFVEFKNGDPAWAGSQQLQNALQELQEAKEVMAHAKKWVAALQAASSSVTLPFFSWLCALSLQPPGVRPTGTESCIGTTWRGGCCLRLHRRCSTILRQLQRHAALSESGDMTSTHAELLAEFAGNRGPSYGSMTVLAKQVVAVPDSTCGTLGCATTGRGKASENVQLCAQGRLC